MSISSLETIIKLDRKYVVLQVWKQQVLNACTIANPELAKYHLTCKITTAEKAAIWVFVGRVRHLIIAIKY
jgi:hypothetical protein